MATQRNQFTTASQTRTAGIGVTVDNRSDYYHEVDYRGDRVSGGFITLPDGSKFRKATPWTRRHVKITPGGKQNTTGKQSSGRVDSIESSPGGYRSDILLTSAVPTFPGCAVARLNSLPTIPQEMRNEASTKALLELADQKAGIGENLATFRQTMSLFANPATALAGGLKAAWKDKSVRPYLGKSIRDVYREGPFTAGAKKYLEYVYGWKPLMLDIYGILELMKESGERPFLISGHGSSKRSNEIGQLSKNDLSYTTQTDFGPTMDNSVCRCKIWGRIDPNTQGLRALNQLGLINPLSLTWELVPWSFVIDWFVPIGPVLQALTAPAGLIFVNGSVSIKTNLNGSFESHRYNLDSVATQNSYATGSYRYEGYRREVLQSWPLPGVWANPTPFSGDRSLKALALTIMSLRNLRL